MNVRRLNRPRAAFWAALVFLFLSALISGVAAVNLASGSFQVGAVGETASIPIVLDSASGGISGYRITVSLSDPSVATITAVVFPDWVSLKSASALPSGQVVLQGVDLSQQVPVGGTGVLLATLTVKGTATGSTGVAIAPDPSLGVQARNGDSYPITVTPGTLTVGTSSPGVEPTLVPTVIVPTSVSATGVPTLVIPPTSEPTSVPTVIIPTLSPTSDGSTSLPISSPVYPLTPVGTSVPGAVSTVNPSGTTMPAEIAPVAQPTFGAGKRYAIGNPGSFIGTRFGSGGTATGPGESTAVTTPEATLKPGSRAYGITPPAGRFIRWYPAERWKAGIK